MQRSKELLERLNAGVVLADGAMGTYLHRRGVAMDRCFPELCLSRPEIVEGVHHEYLAAGAELLQTNSYGAHRLGLERHGLASQARRINIHSARVARQAAAGKAFVAGSIGPLGATLEPVGSLSHEEALTLFEEQASALAEGGVDALVIETISDLDELVLATRAARAACDLPIIVFKTFVEDGQTLSGELPAVFVERVQAAGADVVGANCTVGPQRMLDIVERLLHTAAVPVGAMPTAGLPRLVEGRIDYHAEPEYMARYTRRFAEAGATLLGGCCGSTPEHIRAMAEVLRASPIHVARRSVTVTSDELEHVEETPAHERSRLGAWLGNRFVVSADVELPRSHDLAATLEHARELQGVGVDVVAFADALSARLRVNPLVAAYEIGRTLGLECLLPYTTRDKNVLGIQSDFLAAHVLGVRNILVSAGASASFGDYPTATTLTDLGVSGLANILQAMNRGLDMAGNSIGEPTRFLTLASVDANAEDMDVEAAWLAELTALGAVGVVTSPVFSREQVERVLGPARGLGLAVIASVLPLRSAAHAEYLHNEIPGISIPRAVREALAGCDDEKRGLELARELVADVAGQVDGIHLIPAYRQPSRVVESIRRLGLDATRRDRVAGS